MRARRSSWRRTTTGIAAALLGIVVVTAVIYPLKAHVPVRALNGLYLVAMLPMAVLWGLVPALTTAVLSMLVFNYFFTPPLYQLTVTDPYTVGTLVVSAITAFVVSWLAEQLQHRAEEAESLASEQAALRRVATLVAQAVPSSVLLSAVAEEAGQLLGADVTVLRRYEPDDAATVVGAWSRAGSPSSILVGRSERLGDHTVSSLIRRTHQPVRLPRHETDAPGAGSGGADFSAYGAVGVPIDVEGDLWGALVVASTGHEPLPAHAESRLAGFTELVATAIASAENRNELIASRARIIATEDTARRRIERDLHDGTQQRLVALALQLRFAERAVPPEAGDLRAQLKELASDTNAAIEELRETTQGIHPAALIRGGLPSALGALARRSALPVDLDVRVERLPEPVEVAAYYVISEALTNAAKHAAATTVHIQVAADDDLVRLEVRDDGRGGARFVTGSGLMGIKDRVEAGGGRLILRSAPGKGSSLRVTLPLTDAEQVPRLADTPGRPPAQGPPVRAPT